jgi:hypothetical protein
MFKSSFHGNSKFRGLIHKALLGVACKLLFETIEDFHVASSMTSPMVAAMLEVFFSRRAGRFNGNNVRKRPKIGHLSGPIETF